MQFLIVPAKKYEALTKCNLWRMLPPIWRKVDGSDFVESFMLSGTGTARQRETLPNAAELVDRATELVLKRIGAEQAGLPYSEQRHALPIDHISV